MLKRLLFILLVSITKNANSQLVTDLTYHSSECSVYNLKTSSFPDSLHVSPNPFATRTLADYSFSANDTVSLEVYNRWGMLILSVVNNSVMPAGSYKDSIIMDAFPDDIYVVLLKLGHRKKILKTISKSMTTAIKSNNSLSLLKVYPNPFTDKIIVEAAFDKNITMYMSLTDTWGKELFRSDITNIYEEINLNFLPAGFFFLKITGDSGEHIFKLIK